jgi:Inner membrane component of T3SS, cytoplasmic domain
MSYRLRYKQHDLELPEGRFVIGRSAQCQLSLDDPLVSRQHALLTVEGESVFVEDLGSRNGVLLNDVRIQGRQQVTLSDRIKIGSQELALVRALNPTRPEGMLRASAPTARLPALGVLGSLAEKALALGHGEEAERIIGSLLREVSERAEAGREVDPEMIDKASRFGVQLAASTGKGSWVDYVIRLHHLLGRTLPTSVVDELHDLMRKVGSVDLALLRAYVAGLRERAAAMGPADRFLVSRIEGLERMVSLR